MSTSIGRELRKIAEREFEEASLRAIDTFKAEIVKADSVVSRRMLNSVSATKMSDSAYEISTHVSSPKNGVKYASIANDGRGVARAKDGKWLHWKSKQGNDVFAKRSPIHKDRVEGKHFVENTIKAINGGR